MVQFPKDWRSTPLQLDSHHDVLNRHMGPGTFRLPGSESCLKVALAQT